MNINATLFAQFIVFFTLVWVVMRFIWPPLIKVIDERRVKIAEGLSAAEESVAAKASTESSVRELLRDAKREAADIVSLAQKRAEDAIDQSRLDAKTVADKQVEMAQEKIALEMNQAKESLRTQVVAITIEGVRKIVEKEVDQKIHEKLLKELAAQL